jgi:hypothetical protein
LLLELFFTWNYFVLLTKLYTHQKKSFLTCVGVYTVFCSGIYYYRAFASPQTSLIFTPSFFFHQGLRFTWWMAALSFVSCGVLTVAALLKAEWGSKAGLLVSIVYVVAFYMYLFAGAAPTAVINGTSVKE